jgi:prevent-host-death family protein
MSGPAPLASPWPQAQTAFPAQVHGSGLSHKCYRAEMDIGLRELRQQASEIIRRVEDGEAVPVTASGRSAARLVRVDGLPHDRWSPA